MIVTAQRPNSNFPAMDPDNMASKTISKLEEKVSLSPAVRDSVRAVLVNFFTSMEKSRKSNARVDIQELEAQRDEKVKNLLTDEQYQTYLNLMEEHKPKRKGGPDDDKMKFN